MKGENVSTCISYMEWYRIISFFIYFMRITYSQKLLVALLKMAYDINMFTTLFHIFSFNELCELYTNTCQDIYDRLTCQHCFDFCCYNSNVKQELHTFPEHLGSPPVFSGVRVTRSLVLCVCFVDRFLSFFFLPL